MARGSWTKERVDLIKALWAEGKTATAIAASLGGTSRSAVLGKVFRLRLTPADAAVTAQSPQHPAPPGHRRRGRPPGIKQQKTVRKKQNEQPPAPSKSRGLSLFELTNETCRWPHGRPGTKAFHFCGAAGADIEGGIPYCGEHMRRAYLPVQKTPRTADRPCTPPSTPVPRPWRVANARGFRF